MEWRDGAVMRGMGVGLCAKNQKTNQHRMGRGGGFWIKNFWGLRRKYGKEIFYLEVSWMKFVLVMGRDVVGKETRGGRTWKQETEVMGWKGSLVWEWWGVGCMFAGRFKTRRVYFGAAKFFFRTAGKYLEKKFLGSQE